MTFKQSITAVMVAAACFAGGAWGYGQYQRHQLPDYNSTAQSSLFSNTSYTGTGNSGPMVDFEKAATKAAPAVVHIRTVMKAKEVSGNGGMNDDLLKQFFGRGFGNGDGSPRMMPRQRASGSGVLISADGYIVTNNH